MGEDEDENCGKQSKMAVGKVEPFDIHKGNWEAYKDRVEQYFVVNEIKEERKVPLLITLMGAEAYELLVTLCTPAKPSTLKYDQIQQLLANHLQPTPSILAERYKFRQRKQTKNESIADYLADLKKLSRFCDFGTWLDESVRDQFVCGLHSESIRLRLFTEKNLKLKTATELAIAMEAAEFNAAEVVRRNNTGNERETTTTAACHAIGEAMGASGALRARARGNNRTMRPEGTRTSAITGGNGRARPSVQRRYGSYGGGSASAVNGTLTADYPRSKLGHGQLCAVCGREHSSETCKYKCYTCRVCNQEGHLKIMCPRWSSSLHYVTSETENQSFPDDDLEVNVSFVKKQNKSDDKYPPYTMLLNVNNRNILMEIDTGSRISCISTNYYKTHFGDCNLERNNLRLCYLTGENFQTSGKISSVVRVGQLTKTLDLHVIDKSRRNLLGREWLVELGLIEVYEKKLELLHYVKTSDKFDLKEFSSRFKEVFSEGLGRYKGGLVTLRVKDDARPVFLRARPLAYALREPVERELERLQQEGVITPVETADWATPIVPVVKSDGSLRICGDYKISLNKYLEVDRFPLPRVEDLFARLHGGEKFSKIDLSQAYAQLVLDDTSKYTVINTHKGLFKYNRLIYGLSSSPGIFQRILEQMFADIARVGVFLDDVIITGLDDQEHLNNLTTVFERLRKYGLKIKKEKCSFMSESITYLGYVINSEGIHTCPKKIEGILNATTPNNVAELRSFIGMTMYYAKFVKNISTILAPLYALLKKEVKFQWSAECNEAFNKVKKLLSSSKVLVHYSPDLPLILTTDASSHGVAGVISHVMPDGSERAIAYASRVLNKAERAYSQIDKEALGIIYSVKKFHQYLYGRRFVLKTDHKPLVTIFGDKAGIPVMAASRLQRWAVILGGYQYDIEYIPTAKNAADALSRLPSTSQEVKDYSEVTYLNFVQDFLPITSPVVKKETENDGTLRKVSQLISGGWPSHCSEEEIKPYFARRQELYTEGGCIMWGYRIVIPVSLRSSILKELHSSHQGMVKMKGIARSFVWWPGIDSEIEQVCKLCVTCATEASAPAKVPPQSWPYHEQAWTRLHIDFLGPFEGRTFFVIIDATTKWIEAFVMPRTTGTAVIKVLMETFARFGLPKEVVSDNGPPFSGQEMEQFMKRNGITHTFCAPYHPASNGAAEGAVKLCKRALRKAIREKVDLDVALQTFLFNYRNCPHSTTGESPAAMLQKRTLRCRLDLLKPGAAVEQRVRQVQSQQRERFIHRPTRDMGQGDPVWMQEYNAREKWVPGTISQVKGNRNYLVTRENGTTSHRHSDQLKKRFKYCVPPRVQFDCEGDVEIETPSPVMTPVQPAPEATAARTGTEEPGPSLPDASTDPPALIQTIASKRTRRPPVRFGFEID